MPRTLLMIGTRKGLWTATSDDRETWTLDGPDEVRGEVHSVAIDKRSPNPRLFMASRSWHWGPQILHSDDGGTTWQRGKGGNAVAFPEDTGRSLESVWSIAPSPTEPDVVWAGSEPSALFRSEDRGESFEMVRSLWDHPHREQWGAGFGGQAIHTLLPHPTDPQQVTVAMSTGGVYRTSDRGESWTPANQGIKAEFMPGDIQYPEFGQCVHKVARDSQDPQRLYAQNHGGVYRSDDGADSWTYIADGLPSEFGFPVVAHPREAGTLYLFPLQGADGRFPVDGRCRVFRSRDAGEHWDELGKGLPEQGFWSAVMRDAMCVDDDTPAGVYFGSRDGTVYGSSDEGETWQTIAEHLPDVLCVRAATI
jgi:photosystem II stability/assembly factor-like uncharacterized protein